jgi:hypothetical protein
VSISDEGNDLGVRTRIHNLWQGAHPFDDLQSWTEKVYGMAPTADTKFFGPLHNGRLKSKPIEPVGEYGASDASARYEYPGSVSRHLISLRTYGLAHRVEEIEVPAAYGDDQADNTQQGADCRHESQPSDGATTDETAAQGHIWSVASGPTSNPNVAERPLD